MSSNNYPPVSWPSDTTDYEIFNYPPFNQYYGNDDTDTSNNSINPYFNFNASNMTDGQIYYDVAFNIFISNYFNPSNSEPSSSYLSPIKWLFYYFFYQIGQVVSWLNYPVSFIQINNPDFFTSNPIGNYGIMGHVFEPTLTDNGTVNFSIVDCNTGVELYRLASSQSLSTINKVVNGNPTTESLSFYDYLILMNVLQVDLTEYPPYQTFISTYTSLTDCLNTNSDPTDCYVNNYNQLGYLYTQTQDIEWNWIYATIMKSKPRVLALYNTKPNYLLGLSFLPWNNMKYIPYDNINNKVLQVSPYSLDNLTTVLKIATIAYGLYFIKSKIKK